MRDFDFYKTDCDTILTEIKDQEKQLKLKRRWLMGLSTNKYKPKQSKDTDFLSNRSLPESVLREDDLFFETIKESVNKALRAGEDEKRHHHVQVDMPLSDVVSSRRVISSHLDALTNKGLYLLAMIIAQGSLNFDKTRRKMKMFIKSSLPKVVETDVFKQISELLNDPQNFQDRTFSTPESLSFQDAAAKVIAGLEDFPLQTLVAMHRKLRGGQATVPQFPSKRCGWSKDGLINQVRKTSEAMLSELNEGDKLPEPLAKALAVATLSMKLAPGYQSSSMEFSHFSPEVQALQNEIAKAIQSLKTSGVRFRKLKTLQPILDPHGKVSKNSLRTAVKKMLTEYLFECVDIDAIPKSLLEILAVINKKSRNKSRKCFTVKETEQEVECLLNVSAQTKQIALDLLIVCELDKDFADAYMEDLEESDDDEDNADSQEKGIRNSQSECMLHSTDLSCSGESMGESKPDVSSTNRNGSSFLTPQKRCKTEKLETENSTDVGSVDPYSVVSSTVLEESMGKSSMLKTDENLMTPPLKRCKIEYDTEFDTPSVLFSKLSFSEEKVTVTEQCAHKNQYLAIQERCDETSIAAYNVIGHMMEVFAQREGLDLDSNDTLYLKGHYSIEDEYQEENQTSSQEDEGSVIAQTVEKLIPSLPKSAAEKLKELLSL